MGSDNLFTALRPAAANLERPFLRTPTGKLLRYAELLSGSAHYAHALIELGVRVGDRVAVQIEKSPEAVLLYFAVLRVGAVFLPLNTAYTLAELEYFLADAQPAILVCAPEKYAAIAPLAQRLGVPRLMTLDADGGGSMAQAARLQPDEYVDVSRAADDLAAILYTSGTTGRSKGAMLTHGNLLSNARVLCVHWHFSAEDVLLHALPIFHIHGLFVAINVTLAAGASMIFLPRFEPQLLLQHLPAVSVMMGVPTFYVRLLKEPRLDRPLAARVRLFISGSAPLLTDTQREWLERTGHVILERYGMSETGMITSNPYDGERLAGSVGLPLPGVALRVVDQQSGMQCARGQIGMIEVKGPNVFVGYWQMPDKTRDEFRPGGFFITGDLGRVDARGYVYIVGRGKDLVITGGYNVYPKEVETELDAIPGVMESAVIGVPHPDFGEGVTAVVVVLPGSALTEGALLAHLRQRLAAYKLPKRVLFIEDLPRNTMGKVQKNVLRERYANLYRG